MSRTRFKAGGNEIATNISAIEVTGQLVVDHRARAWCTLPYPGHPRGCPNYGKTPDCPPQAPCIEDWLDFSRPHWFVIARFDLGGFAARMKSRHPNWSARQCRCCLYWQKSVQNKLSPICNNFKRAHQGTIFSLRPEAMGINVFSTANALRIPIEIRPRKTVTKMALVGYPKESI